VKHRMVKLISFSLVLFFAFAIAATFSTTLADVSDDACTRRTLEVKLTPLDLETYTLVGWHCSKANTTSDVVQLLLHGATYNHSYWDFPYEANKYSYVDYMIKAGYSVFNVDRIGAGESDRPAVPELLNIQTDAYIVHQVVQALKNGQVGGNAYDKVILVGHSMGTAMSWEEAGVYGDVDGIVSTGLLHNVDPVFAANAITNSYPANQDPKFQGQGLADGYLTTRPGTRDELFYYAQTADPQVIALDEQMKDTVTDGEVSTITHSSNIPTTITIDVPVISVIGEFDNVSCGASLNCSDVNFVKTHEAAYFSPKACLETYVISQTGHDLNLHLSAQTSYATIKDWLVRRIGTDNVAPTQPCN
jgi:pimeloyl-ACP methyl ester carboxylesterase